MILVVGEINFTPVALLLVAVGMVFDAFTYSSFAVAPYPARIVTLTTVVVVELEVHTHVATDILPLGARVVVVTATGEILLKKD